MSPPNLSPPNLSKTQRFVLLIDLHPLLTLLNPNPYLAAVTSAAARLLRLPHLAAALSAFKLFFSSLSPLRSAAALPPHLSTPSLSFDLPTETLASLSSSLNSISTLADLPNSRARASHAASSLLQLIHDYAWEIEKDHMLGEDDSIDGDFMRIRSNLVVLFSPVSQSVNRSVDYSEMREFDEVFRAVREAFVVRDIHLCWIDVKSDELEIDVKKNDEVVSFRDGVRKMGWGFCSSDLIVLGSALLPFDLIYPKIGVSFDFVDFGGVDNRKFSGELSLEILDVNEKPLECKCCDLEFVSLKSLPSGIKNDDIFNNTESRDLWVRLGEGNVKLRVKSVHRYDEYEKTGGSLEIVLVRESFDENKKASGYDLFAKRVLEMVHEEIGGVACRNQLPSWQMFLSFLYMKGYWALVSLSSSNGDTLLGCLKPFTTHLAILYIMDAGPVPVRDKIGSNRVNDSNTIRASQTDTSTSGNRVRYGDGKMKKSQRHLYQKMTWSSFCKAAVGGSSFDLFELFIARYIEKSKRLKFLKCWMKQISQVDVNYLTSLPGSMSMEGLSACSNAVISEPSPAKEGSMPVSNSETSETFFNNLPMRIQHGLESGMDLQNLAERVVTSSVHWLRHKCEVEFNSESQQSMRFSDDSCSEAVGGKLIELLLRSPKEMKKIQQDSDPSSSENIVREYEWQVFLRIEILRSDVSTMLGESRKQKLLKQICSLLEIIQYLVAGGIHGHASLYDYVERTIRARYSDELVELVNKIYIEMDLLPFGDEEEAPSLLFNSEDSNQSWRDKYDRNEKNEPTSINQSFSTEGESSQPPTSACDGPQKTEQDEYTQTLNEARERRERARRFAPFVSKALDLQRVWAPKQPKVIKGKLDHLPNKSKRQPRSYSVVCETPMSGNKRRGDKGKNDIGNSSYSVSKALFQDD